MKAPITPTQAWAVIAEAARWNEKELPELPDRDLYSDEGWNRSDASIRDWGMQCAAHAREQALSDAMRVCNAASQLYYTGTFAEAAGACISLSMQIEALKGK